MNNLQFVEGLDEVNFIIKIIELIFIVLFTNYSFIKIVNIENIKKQNVFAICLTAPIISIISKKLEYETNPCFSLCILVLLITLFNVIIYKNKKLFALIVTIICLSINYIVYVISLIISFIPFSILKVQNDYIMLICIVCIYVFIMINLFKMKKIKYGISFLQNILKNTYFDLLILNIGCLILFLIIILQDHVISGSPKLITIFIILSITMFLTIKQAFNLYYKQNLLTKDLEQTKTELEEKKQEISKLEKENLEFSKKSHSLAHKQKSLEYKLEQLIKTGVDTKSQEIIKQEIENISKEVYKEPQRIELPKTEIESIDDMFSYMQSECIKDNIKFELQVVGNVFYLINHLISENELEILLADHIKDAIIAINHSDNMNRSILVRIGKIDNVYGLYIYDSGIEFKKEVLDNLGKRPITTYADSGGTGMGFMNTFDTLNKAKVSLIINEIGKPSVDNYTKVLIFKFDNKNEFIVNSYKDEKLLV